MTTQGTLLSLARGIRKAKSPAQLLEVLGSRAKRDGAHRLELLYAEPDEAGEPEWLEVCAGWYRDDQHSEQARLYVPASPLAKMMVAHEDQTTAVGDVEDDTRVDGATRAACRREGVAAFVMVPMSRAGQLVAVGVFAWAEPHDFGDDELAEYSVLMDLAPCAAECLRLEQEIDLVGHDALVFNALVNEVSDGLGVLDAGGIFTFANREAERVASIDSEKGTVVGSHIASVFSRVSGGTFADAILPQAMEHGWHGQLEHVRRDATPSNVEMVLFPIQGPELTTVAVGVIARELSESAAKSPQQQTLIDAQWKAIEELSTPIIPVMDRVIVMPLVGSIDTHRARQIMRALLKGISQYMAKVVIIDLTGVPVMDTGVAGHLNKTILAARLKGAQTVLAGVSEFAAETIVEMGIDWADMLTVSDLQTGLTLALRSLGIRMVHDKESVA